MRTKPSLDKPAIIERFSNELRGLVKDVSANLKELFEDSIDGGLGDDHRSVVAKLFDEWCSRNDVVPLMDLHRVLIRELKEIVGSQDECIRKAKIDRVIENIEDGLKASHASKENDVKSIVTKYVAEAISHGNKLEEIAWKCSKELLRSYISLFLDQTAHVIIARLLVYKVMEDKGYVPKKLDNVLLDPQFDALKTLIDIRQRNEALLPDIYALSEFDWWYVPDIKRGLLDDQQKKLLARHEDTLRNALNRAVRTLVGYDLSGIDFDIWQRIYQYYLPEEERQRLGGFYTPYELVSLIIDLSEYKQDVFDLCKMKVLDPACGSGTFVVEVARRLIKHLEAKAQCHTLPETEWGKARLVLDAVKESIYAIDIHPFATFLTSLNLAMLLLDYYFKVRHQDSTYTLELNVITADSLAKEVQAQVSMKDYFNNARLKEARERLKKYKKALEMKFDYVFGNPPWGSVLKGQLSPLWNPKKREEYGKVYKSARGKYDVYVLFMEKGIEWLKEGGVLGMVVNNRFLTRDFGKRIREVISSCTEMSYLVDLSEYGPDMFPGATNYPVVIVLRKRRCDGRGVPCG